MTDITIITLKETDVERLQAISRLTFQETFGDENSEADMQAYLDSGFSGEKLRGELRDENSRFWMAQLNGEDIGYLKLNMGVAQTETQQDAAMEIERIYVVKAQLGNGVGQKLLAWALEQAKASKVHYIWLGVWERNARAIHFYRKNGFVEFGKHVFKLGDDEQIDIMMKRWI